MSETAPDPATPQPQEVPLARKASRRDARIKLMAWGEPGAGKSRLGLSFPAPLVVDLERSTDLYADEFDFWVAAPGPGLKPAHLVHKLVKQIEAGMYPDRETLVIDPATDWIDSLETGIIDKMKGRGVNLDALAGLPKARAYSEINDTIRDEINKVLALPMHVVFVVRAKNEWGKNRDGKMDVTGRRADIKEIVPYLCDLVIEVQPGGTGLVKKSRLAALPETVKAMSFADIAAALGAPRLPLTQEENDALTLAEVRAKSKKGGTA